MLPRESKLLLANIIRHTDTHNRILEEEECWKQRSLQRTNEARKFSRSLECRDFDIQRRYQLKKDACGSSRAHMDCEDDTRSFRYEGREEPTSTFWMQQLDKAESEDPERWGHSGYKELYPQDFVSDSDGGRAGDKAKNNASKKRPHSPDATEMKHRSSSVRRKKKDKKKARKKSHLEIELTSGEQRSHKSKKHKKDIEYRAHKDKKKRHKRHKKT